VQERKGGARGKSCQCPIRRRDKAIGKRYRAREVERDGATGPTNAARLSSGPRQVCVIVRDKASAGETKFVSLGKGVCKDLKKDVSNDIKGLRHAAKRIGGSQKKAREANRGSSNSLPFVEGVFGGGRRKNSWGGPACRRDAWPGGEKNLQPMTQELQKVLKKPAVSRPS